MKQRTKSDRLEKKLWKMRKAKNYWFNAFWYMNRENKKLKEELANAKEEIAKLQTEGLF